MRGPLVGSACALVLWLSLAGAQRPGEPATAADDPHSGPRLKPSQVEEILKADRAKSIEDAGRLIELSEELKRELEKNDKHVLSVAALKKSEEIEKLAKRIRGRLKRF
ncbi:MAG: hypothetical protein IT162_01880 [Bryobacterales bacterium]|nr:hypothetical protein [Bryobacterales bacterium]